MTSMFAIIISLGICFCFSFVLSYFIQSEDTESYEMFIYFMLFFSALCTYFNLLPFWVFYLDIIVLAIMITIRVLR